LKTSILHILSTIALLGVLVDSVSAQTYYSRSGGGNWDNASSWTLNSSGSGGAAGIPGRTDDVVILSGHTIVVNATDDNSSSGVSPNGLIYPNVGTFADAGTACFYHMGDVSINSGGTLTASVCTMFEGSTQIDGTFSNTDDIVNIGDMYISSGATFSTDDDFICSGFSTTQIDVTINSDDDIYLDHTDAQICGSGTVNVGVNSSNTPIINYNNGATIAQFCSGFSITCGPGGGCSGFPQTGTGAFTIEVDSFAYYRYITIQSSEVAADLTNFPVLISITSPDIRTVSDGGHVESANGYDIVFSTSNNCGDLSRLKHQIESYSSNVTTGTLVAWVNVPFVSSSTDTEIFMYYGSPDATADPSTSGTFDYDYVNIYHLHDDFDDATIYGNDATNSGSADQTNSIIADGQTFGAGDYIEAPTTDMITGEGTVSSWAYSTSFSGAHHYIIGHTTVPAFNNRLQLYTNDAGGNLDLGMGNNHNENTGIFNFNTNEWYYVVLTWDNPDYIVYVNGNEEATGTYASFTSLHSFIDIGNDGLATNRGENWVGDLDETRVSVVERSASWIETEYNNQSSPGTFFTLGSELENTCIALPIELVSFTAYPENNNTVILDWTTESEINNDFFTIERSEDLKSWEVVDTLAGAGNSQVRKSYSLIDRSPLKGWSYYRLKQTDFDGLFKYSKVVSVKIEEDGFVLLYPNPTSGLVYLSMGNKKLNTSDFQWYDSQNRPVNVKSVSQGQMIAFDTETLSPGLYFIRSLNEGPSGVYKVIVSR
jgi:biopolymer transport protein ExbB